MYPKGPYPLERERRFIVDEVHIFEGADFTCIEQAYVFSKAGHVVRIRLESNTWDSEISTATVAVKGPRTGISRYEKEVDIDSDIAKFIVNKTELKVSKQRYSFPYDGQVWDIDRFNGENSGLIIAELEGLDIEQISIPSWASREITGITKFNNEELAANPLSNWMDGGSWGPQSVWDF